MDKNYGDSSLIEESIIARIHKTNSINDLQDGVLFEEPIATSTAFSNNSRKNLVEDYLQSVASSLKVPLENNREQRRARNSSFAPKSFDDVIKEAKERFQSLGDISQGENTLKHVSNMSIADCSSDKLQSSAFLEKEVEVMLNQLKIHDSSLADNLPHKDTQSHTGDSLVRISAISCPWNSDDDDRLSSLRKLTSEHNLGQDGRESFHEFSNDGDDFRAMDEGLFDQDEEEFVKSNKIMLEDVCSAASMVDASSFYGREGDDISINVSRMDNTLRDLVKTGNRIKVDELFKAKSYKLGVLGGGGVSAEKPSFGSDLPIDSPSKLDVEDPAINLSPPTAVVRNLSKGPLQEPPPPGKGSEDGQDAVMVEQIMKIVRTKGHPKDLVNQILEYAKMNASTAIDESEVEATFESDELPCDWSALHNPVQNLHSNGLKLGDSAVSIRPTALVPAPQLIGVTSDNALDAYNNLSQPLQIRIESMKEMLNETPLVESCLEFASCYSAEAKSPFKMAFKLLSMNQGVYVATLNLGVYGCPGNADASGRAPPQLLESKVVTFRASFVEPQLEMRCQDEDWVDFGNLFETCTSKRKIVLRNECPWSYPVALKLHPICSSVEVLFWGEESRENFMSLSASVLCCHLPEGPSAELQAEVHFRAPHLQGLQESSTTLQSTLQIFYVLPNGTLKILKSVPIKAKVSKICLRTPKVEFPIALRAPIHSKTTLAFLLYNESDIPLRMSLRMSSDGSTFSVSPSELTIEPGLGAEPTVSFLAKAQESFQGALSMIIEPDGAELEVPFLGECSPPEVPLKRTLSPLQVSKSVPLDCQLPKDVSLKSNKTRFAFGCVSLGEEESQRLVVRNGWTSHALTLAFVFIGSDAFKISYDGSSERSSSLEIQLEPRGEATLHIHFRPADICPHRATLVSKPRGLQKPVKFSYPLQGYGGRGKLAFPPNMEFPDHLSFGRILPGKSAIIQTVVENVGSRPIFVKLQITQDETGDSKFSDLNIMAIPNAFILKPNASRDVVILATGSPIRPRPVDGRLARLVVVHGNEVMRQRFKLVQHVDFKRSKVSDASLLQVDWAGPFSNEEEGVDAPTLPSQPEDALLFFQDCCKNWIALCGEFDFCPLEETATLLALTPEDTICSTTASPTPQRRSALHSSKPQREIGLTSDSLVIFPPAVNFVSSTTCSVTIENLTEETVMVEVSSNEPWLSIKPEEVELTPFGSRALQVSLHPARLPWATTTLHSSFEILWKNGMTTVKVNVDASFNPAAQHKTSKLLAAAKPKVFR